MIECGYEKVNFVRQPPHHTRKRREPILVQADGYPQLAKTNQRRRPPGGMSVANLGEEWTPCKGVPLFQLGPPDADGHRPKNQLGIWRGVDKSCLTGTYDGPTLRSLRAQKGCGRPFITNIWRQDHAEGSDQDDAPATA